jgi:hypothetical protein
LVGTADTAAGTAASANGPPAVLSDSGSDTDGGDDYQLRQPADNIDLQGDGAILGADRLGATRVTTPSRGAEFVVWDDGSTYHADGPTGLIDSGPDLATVWQAAYDAMQAAEPVTGPGESNRAGTNTLAVTASGDLSADIVPAGRTVTHLSGEIRGTDSLTNAAIDIQHDATHVTGGGFLRGASAASGQHAIRIGGGAVHTSQDLLQIRAWPGDGVATETGSNVQIASRLRINGCGGNGVETAEDSIIAHCDIGQCNNGMVGGNKSTIIGCNSYINDNHGIITGSRTWIANTRSNENAKNGIVLFPPHTNTTVANCAVFQNGQTSTGVQSAGIQVAGDDNLITAIISDDQQSTTTQNHAVYANGGDYNGYVAISTRGNAQRGIGGTLGPNSEKAIII